MERFLRAAALGVSWAIAAYAGPPPGNTRFEARGIARVDSRPAADVIVWLDAPNAPEGDRRRAVLDQRNLQFEPRVLAVRVGTTVDFPNNDRVFHNVFSFRNGKRFDLGAYPVGTVRQVTFDRLGLSRVFCNIHPNMAAYIMTLDTPHFAVTDAAGSFTIPDVPGGSHPYHAWRAGAPQLEGVWRAGMTLEIEWR